MEPLAFQVQHGIDHVLQDSRAGNRAFLGHVPDDEHRNVAWLCPLHDPARALPHLGDASRRRRDLVDHHGLDGVDHQHAGVRVLRRGKDRVEIRFRQNEDVVRLDAEPIGPELDLLR